MIWDSSPSSTRTSITPPNGGGEGSHIGDGGTLLFELSLNIERLASSIMTAAASLSSLEDNSMRSAAVEPSSVIPFLLRRSGHDAHEIALSKFRDAMMTSEKTLSPLKQRLVRRDYINTVVKVYSENIEKQHFSRRRRIGAASTIVVNDWKCSLHLIEECSTLLVHAGLDDKNVHAAKLSSIRNDNSAMSTDDVDFRQVLDEDDSVLYQTEVIQKILLPMAKIAFTNHSTHGSGCDVVIDIAVRFVTALDRYRCVPCPALEFFVVIVLWRSGYTQELLAFLRSRSDSTFRVAATHEGFDNGGGSTIPPDLINTGTWMLVSSIVAIVRGSTSICDGRHDDVQRQMISESMKILSSRVSDPQMIVETLRNSENEEDVVLLQQVSRMFGLKVKVRPSSGGSSRVDLGVRTSSTVTASSSN